MTVRTTTSAMKVSHAGTTPPSVMPTASAWTYGSWVQMVAATAAPTTIAGMYIGAANFAELVIEWQIGTGAAASETPIHTWRTYGPNWGNIAAPVYLWPVPLGGIAAGTRLSMRVRTHSGSGTFTAGLLYYEDFDSTHVATTPVMTGTQIGTAMVAVTPSGSAWGSSAWVELTPGVDHEIAILGLNASAETSADVEWEMGTGAAAAEVVRTTVRSPVISPGTGLMRSLWFPAPFPVPPSTRVVARMRKAGTATTPHAVSMVYLDPTGLL